MRSHKPSPTPLIVPPRADHLPVPASAISATQESNPFGYTSQGPSSQQPSSVGGPGNGETPQLVTIRPLTTYPRKSSLADSISSGISTSTGTSSHISSTPSAHSSSHGPPTTSASSPYTPPGQQYHYSGGLTPQTAPAGFGGPPTDQQQSIPRSLTTPALQSQSYPQIFTTPTTPVKNTQIPATIVGPNAMLSTIPEGLPKVLSRDSRISLPDEARQYIANMTDSPTPSPRLDAFAFKTGPPSRIAQPHIVIPENPAGLAPPAAGSLNEADSPGGSSEFLDMNEDEEDEDEADEPQSAVTETEADESEYGNDSGSVRDAPRQQAQPTQQTEVNLQTQGRKPKARAAVEDFPLPPPIIHPPNSQPMTQAQLFAQAQAASGDPDYLPAYASTDQISPLENPYSPPSQQPSQQPMRLDQKQESQQQPSVQTVPASFRALPLISTDLPHTTITVAHSFVRPNDRGKEVLSFVVYVDPGHGKEGWKVEKMYSDVLGLDQRVRNSVGKGVGKKMSGLPEGKLWKDHAPAKVDQRKVRLSI